MKKESILSICLLASIPTFATLTAKDVQPTPPASVPSAALPTNCQPLAGLPRRVSGLCQNLCSYYDHAIAKLDVIESKFQNQTSVKAIRDSLRTNVNRSIVSTEGQRKGSVYLLTSQELTKLSPKQLLNILASAKQNSADDANSLYPINNQNISVPGFLKIAIENGCRNYTNAPATSKNPNERTQRQIEHSLASLAKLFENSFKALPAEHQKVNINRALKPIKAMPLIKTFISIDILMPMGSITITSMDPKINIDPADAINARHINDMNTWFKSIVNGKAEISQKDYNTLVKSFALTDLVPNQSQHFTDPFHFVALAKMLTLQRTNPSLYLVDLKDWKDGVEKILYIKVLGDKGKVQQKTIVDFLMDAMRFIDDRNIIKDVRNYRMFDKIANQVFNNLNTALLDYKKAAGMKP